GPPAATLIACIVILVACGVVQFASRGFDENVIIGEFPIIDLRSRDLQRFDGDNGRDVLDEKLGQTLRGDLIYGPEDEPVAVCIREMLIDPYSALQGLV